MLMRRGLALIALLAVFVTGPAAGESPARALSGGASGDNVAAGAAQACGGLPRFSKATADAIMAGKLTISPFPAVTIDPDKDGSVNWNQNPFHHPTWQQDFQSGGWIEMLISGYLAGGSAASAYLARAEVITKGWLAGVPIGGRDPQVLICLAEGFPGQAWIDDQVDVSVNWLAGHWQGAWNHGLVQDIKLMRIACAYPTTAFGGDALKWRKTAYSQMLASFQPNRLGPSIDTSGVVNEQATGYERFVWDLWLAGEPEVAACGYRLPAGITARIAKMPAFMADATQPDGNLAQIGDTYVEPPPGLPRGTATSRVAVFAAGYAFGRSQWGPNGTFYSLRFGPGRQVHGHNDHMGITYYSRGRNLIVNAGHTGYEVSAYRTYIQSPEAASTLIAPGKSFRASAATTLAGDSVKPRSQYFQFADSAFGGPRKRSVYVHQGADFMLVLDRDQGAPSYQQLWHLDPGLTVTSVTASRAVATAPAIGATATSPAFPATALTLVRIPLPGQAIRAGSTTVVKGRVSPYQGWVSHRALQRIPAPVVTMTGKGAGTALTSTMLTLITATAPGTRVTTRVASSAGHYVAYLTIGTATIPVNVNLSTGTLG
jgi:Heparinase II/III-like protein